MPITNDCKELLKGMLNKDPLKRTELVDIQDLPYFKYTEEELEEKVQQAKKIKEEQKQMEEEKAEKSWESNLISGINLNSTSSNSPPAKRGGSKTTTNKDKTPSGKSTGSGSIKLKKNTSSN